MCCWPGGHGWAGGLFGVAVVGFVDPCPFWESGRSWTAAEPFGMGDPGGVEGLLPLFTDLSGGAVMHRCRGVQADPGVPVFVVVVGVERLAVLAACWIDPNRSGKLGSYFNVLKLASMYGLSFDVFGRL